MEGWITSSSTLEWKGFGDKESHPIYKGDVENGKPSGLGVITFPDGSKFVGEYKDGEKNGQGNMTYHDAVGVRLREAPMSPVKVLKALNQKNRANR